jgi:hypothetical protein
MSTLQFDLGLSMIPLHHSSNAKHCDELASLAWNWWLGQFVCLDGGIGPVN